MTRRSVMVVSIGDGVVHVDGLSSREPLPVVGEVAPPWSKCVIPDCTHSPACPAKLRAWGGYGARYICSKEGCRHRSCPPKRRAEADRQVFNEPYKGPVLPSHTVGRDGKPLGPRLYAVRGADGQWRLLPDPPTEPAADAEG